MRHNKLGLYYHMNWTTWDREAIITPDIERRLHREMECEAQNCGAVVIAIGGIEDHVHLLLSLPPTVTVSYVLKQVKGVSSKFANNQLGFNGAFRWQGAYSAHTVSRWDVEKIKHYIENQKEHHQRGTTIEQLEQCFRPKKEEQEELE